MRHRAPQCLLAVATSALLAACGDTPWPIDPAASRRPAEPVMAAATTAAAVPMAASNTWAPRATIESNYPFYGFTAAAAKNAAGQWIVYAFGGASDEGGGNWPILAYNVATNTWAPKPPGSA